MRLRTQRIKWCVGLMSAFGLAGCGTDGPGLAPVAPEPLLWDLALNHHTVTLSTAPGYDTVRLVATPRMVDGTPLREARVRYQAQDVSDTTVVVDSVTGLVTAHAPTSGRSVSVVASVTMGRVTLRENVVFQVTTRTTPPRLATLTLRTETGAPLFPTSAPGTIACNIFGGGAGVEAVIAEARDAAGTVIPEALPYYTSSHPLLLEITSDGQLLPRCIEDTWTTLTVTTTVYGITRVASIPIHLVPPTLIRVDVLQRIPTATGRLESYAEPRELTLSVGGIVYWVSERTATTQPYDVVFDDPTDVRVVDTAVALGLIPASGETGSSGDITPFEPPEVSGARAYRVRYFPRAGIYRYHSALHGTSGTIIVAAPAARP